MTQQIDLGGPWSLVEIKLSKSELAQLTPEALGRRIRAKGLPAPLGRKPNGIAAQVPGDVWQDLIRAGKIPHPFDGVNCPKLQWIEDCVWCYRKTFRGPAALGDRTDLVFEGLDTFAEIFLNGESLGQTDNMFRPWRFDVTRRLRPDAVNELVVVFHPWQIHVKDRPYTKLWGTFVKERVWARKAQMESGWDWGPRIVLAGIWRPVRLETITAVRIAGWHFKTLRADARSARVQVEVELDRTVRAPVTVDLVLRNGGQKITKTATVSGNGAALTVDIPNPRLWWPRNLGKPDRYNVTLTAAVDGKIADRLEAKAGIRTVELIQKPQGKGCKSFTFAVNGKKVFLAGADWIPADSFLASVTPDRYRAQLVAAAEANMNAIRVWGGGIYEDEAFYEACDELGLMVWQDFMFACGSYPGTDAGFVRGVEEEFRHAIRRLRVHPSIILWNGNNEVQWCTSHITWDKKDKSMPDRNIYHSILPRLTRQLDGTRPYWPGSPFGGNDDNDWRQGNHHSWQVWGGCRIPRKKNERADYPPECDHSEIRHYRHYADVVPRFCSEFGLHAPPYRKTLAKYLKPADFRLGSKALIFRDKACAPDRPLHVQKWFLKNITGWASDYDDFELKAQLAQARGVHFAIAHYRRNLWQCSGALIWQLNDCWPGFSWSLLDYDRLPKPIYFAVKRAFSPRYLSLYNDGRTFGLWAVNTGGRPWSARVQITVRKFTGEILGQARVPLAVADQVSKCIVPDVLRAAGVREFDPAEAYVKAEIVAGPGTYPAWCFDDPVRLNLPRAELVTRLKVQPIGKGFRHDLTITSPRCLAYFVGVIPPSADCRFADNFINIDPGATAQITFVAPKKYDAKSLQLRAYNA